MMCVGNMVRRGAVWHPVFKTANVHIDASFVVAAHARASPPDLVPLLAAQPSRAPAQPTRAQSTRAIGVLCARAHRIRWVSHAAKCQLCGMFKVVSGSLLHVRSGAADDKGTTLS